MCDDNPIVLNLPKLSDEAIVAIYNFLQDAVGRFENQYFAQMHRYYQDLEEQGRQYRREQRKRQHEPPSLDNDPPF
jgi:hypothetical protein